MNMFCLFNASIQNNRLNSRCLNKTVKIFSIIEHLTFKLKLFLNTKSCFSIGTKMYIVTEAISKLLIFNKTHHAHHSCNKRTESVRPTDAGSQICSGIFCAVSSEHLHQLFGSDVFQELLKTNF